MPSHRFGYRTSAAERAGRYNYQHQQARKRAAARHDPSDPCTRCRHPLGPMGPSLHYDHTDDGTDYLGFAHGAPCPTCGQRCNVKAGAIRGNQRQSRTGSRHHPDPTQPTRRATRTW